MFKKRILYSIIFVFLLAIVGIYFYFKIKPNKSILSLIPQNYERLIVFHTASLLGNAVDETISLEKLTTHIPGILKNANWSKLGINPFGDIAFYSIEEAHRAYNVCIIPVFSEKKANTFAVEELQEKLLFKKLNSNFFYHKNNSIACAIENGYLYTIYFATKTETVSENLLKEIIEINPKESVLNDTLILANNKNDCYAYAVFKKKPSILTNTFLDSAEPFILKWERNNDTLRVSYTEAIVTNKPMTVPVYKSDYFSFAFTGNIIEELGKLKPEVFSNFQIKANNLSIDSAFLYKNMGQGISFAYFGKDSILNKHISYEFDDNFNKVEVVSESTEFIDDFALQLNFKSEAIKDSIIKILSKNGLLRAKNGRFQIIGVNPRQVMYVKHSGAKMLLTGTGERLDTLIIKNKIATKYTYLDLKIFQKNKILNNILESSNITTPIILPFLEVRIESSVNNNKLVLTLTVVPNESLSVFDMIFNSTFL